ncbi:4-amino-4-deoxychorismate lyase [Cribrihabitans marinus]|uniref:Probable branched-chain-amino-acid aminotransferase n=1 Tax=Cribrihabitans marinus TaxID=1227549 RepID=A0A1H6SP87_9RHOB|nr:aminotransferase class IV family protein [Cribrihabitans marinus]GGH23039.1 aminotransferase class IV [Cribrihabitans marinus]SEI69749.1 4-amino-4-deoxychorismate lyase [Cribrihabitans marinus]
MEGPLRAPAEPGFRLIETLGYRPGTGLVRRDRHLERMARTAAALEIPFDRRRALACLAGADGPAPLRCRLTMDAEGGFRLGTGALDPNPPRWRVAIAAERLRSDDPWLRHKTTRRALYDRVRSELPEGVDEMLFLNEAGALCEGTITNLFVATSRGLVTPPASAGLLPGILRAEMLETGRAVEGDLTVDDLVAAPEAHVGNALRGLIPVRLVGQSGTGPR